MFGFWLDWLRVDGMLVGAWLSLVISTCMTRRPYILPRRSAACQLRFAWQAQADRLESIHFQGYRETKRATVILGVTF